MNQVIVGLVAMALFAQLTETDRGPVQLVDYSAIKQAIEASPEAPARAVSFRELWNDPAGHRGQFVQVEGRIERRFRQPAVGAFPALTEAWIITDDHNPICVMFPTGPAPRPRRQRVAGPESAMPRSDGLSSRGIADSGPATRTRLDLGARVRFSGRFLRLVSYRSADAERLAPLIVGRDVPRVIASQPVVPAAEEPSWDWLIATILAVFVAGMLAIQHLRQPPSRWLRTSGPPPSFASDRDEEEGGPADA